MTSNNCLCLACFIIVKAQTKVSFMLKVARHVINSIRISCGIELDHYASVNQAGLEFIMSSLCNVSL